MPRKDKHYRIIKGQLFARYVFTDAHGKRREKHIKADSKTHARELYEQMRREYAEQGESAIDAERLLFRELARIFEEDRLQPAIYKGDTKITGMRSYKMQRSFLRVLVAHFGAKRVRAITYHDLTAFRTKRFTTKTRRGAERSVANVNRELSLLRSVFTYAKRAGWITKSPFEAGVSLISLADEVRRDRLLTPDEEARLLAACVGRREHLKAIVIAAIDTAMRKGELLQLVWSDVDLARGVITVRATTTKTRRGRMVGITARLRQALEGLWENGEGEREALVFGQSDVKRSFATACRVAGIEDLHFHDLRHLGTTKMIQAGMPPAEVMKITGHTRFETFARYLNVNQDTAQRAAAALDRMFGATQPESPGG